MRLLTGSDAATLYQELPEVAFHTLKLLVLRDDWTAEGLRERLHEREAVLEPLCWRLVVPPLPIAHPWWRLGPSPELDHHVCELTLPPGSSLRAACAEAARLSEPLLERDRPLWRMWVLRGLPAGRAAVLIKWHHALADGAASRELIERIFGAAPPPGVLREDEEPEPAGWRQLLPVVKSMNRTIAVAPAVLGGTIRALRRSRALTRAGVPPARAAFSGATPPWDRRITTSRALAVVEVPMASVHRIRDRHGATTSEVLVAVLGGALRPLLAADTELIATLAVSTRRDTDDPWGNHSFFSFETLATDRADPDERLAAVAAESRAARKRWTAEASRALEGWFEFYPLQHAVRILAEGAMRRFGGRVTAAAIVSSMAGPQRLEHGNVRVDQLFSVGPLATGILLNLTAWSYGEVLSLGLLACPDGGLDPWVVADAIPTELAALDASDG